jgi:hypothetical protein
MEEYAHRKNIERFERELASEQDPRRRGLIENLLTSEHEQLARVLREQGASSKKAVRHHPQMTS